MKKRTRFLIRCGQIVADRRNFELQFDTWSTLGYFCNAADLLGQASDSARSKSEKAMNFFNDLYKEDAEKVCSSQKLSLSGYFGSSYNEASINHRLMAIAFAAAVSETEK